MRSKKIVSHLQFLLLGYIYILYIKETFDQIIFKTIFNKDILNNISFLDKRTKFDEYKSCIK